MSSMVSPWVWLGAFVLLLGLYISSYPRWEMALADVAITTGETYLAIRCAWDKGKPCTALENFQLLKDRRDAFNWTVLDPVRWETHTILMETRDHQEIPLFVAYPRNTVISKWPVLLEFHGGGHVMGVQAMVLVARALERTGSKFVVVSPGYRKAPQFPFPFAPHDCLDALLWVRQNIGQHHGDAKTVWIAGTSAGGNLAAAVTQAVLQEPEKYGKVQGQILFSPITDFHFATKSFYKQWSTPYWSGQKGVVARRLYVPDPVNWKNPLASPLYGTKWEGFPKSFVMVDSEDPLRDEGIDYKEKLVKGGNEVVFMEVVGYHASVAVAGASGIGYEKDIDELVKQLSLFFSRRYNMKKM